MMHGNGRFKIDHIYPVLVSPSRGKDRELSPRGLSGYLMIRELAIITVDKVHGVQTSNQKIF